MVWLIVGIVAIIAMSAAQPYLSERGRRIFIDVVLSFLVIIVAGFLTRVIFLGLSSAIAAYFVGTPIAIIAGVGSILSIPVTFLVLLLVFYLIIRKLGKK